jgi:hypothetical protein
METRRRELRVMLRQDKVGHADVLGWLEEMERDGRGVSGLQAEVIAVLASHAKAVRKAGPVARRGSRAGNAPALVTKEDRAAMDEQGERLGASADAGCEDPLEMAARRLEF